MAFEQDDSKTMRVVWSVVLIGIFTLMMWLPPTLEKFDEVRDKPEHFDFSSYEFAPVDQHGRHVASVE